MTQENKKISVSSGIDWLSCTISIEHFERIRSRLGFFELVEPGEFEKVNPLHGYTSAIKLLGGRLQWGFPQEQAFCHFELSGQGCQLLGGRIWELLIFLKSLLVKFTRIDLAFDFQNTKNLMSSLRKDLNSGRFTGFQTWQEISTNKLDVKATTFYLGSRSSSRFARIYDKGLESGLYELAEKLIRFEFIFRSEQCQVVAQLLLNDASVVSDVAGLTFNLYRFGVFKRGSSSNEWRISLWYQKLLDSFENLRLRDMPSLPRNLDFERFCKWLVEQVSPSLKDIARENLCSPGNVLDTILYYYPSERLQINHKNIYLKAYKKMIREKVDLKIL